MTSRQRPQPFQMLLLSVLFCAILFSALGLASAVLKPKRSLLKGEAGAAWAGYLEQERDTVDVVFFGNSHVFDGIDPSTIWRESGVTSYVMAGPTQPLSVTKHYIAETFRTQRPKVIAVELSSMTYGPDRFSREFHQINVGYMPWSAEKVKAIADATPAKERVGVALDLWAYHSRWHEVTRDDLRVVGRPADDAFLKGWFPIAESKPVTPTAFIEPAREKPGVVLAERQNLRQLREIAELCERNDAQLLIFLTPTSPKGGYSRFLRRAAAGLGGYQNVVAFDMDESEAVSLSYERDFFDGGHLSINGAEKASRALGRYLADTYQLEDHRGDPRFRQWDDDAEKRDAYIESLRKKQ